jgi:putative ATP-dependent endonuclease of OLD family
VYLESLHIVNFRRLADVDLHFQPGLNVILGENNSGKSAVIDALRHVFSLGSDRRDIYCSEDDFHHDTKGNVENETFELHVTFADLSPDEQAHFSICLSPSEGEGTAQLHLRIERMGGAAVGGSDRQYGAGRKKERACRSMSGKASQQFTSSH